jgi:hypothetical protein
MSKGSAPRPQRDPSAIEEKLRAALEAARERETKATREFRSAIPDTSSIPIPQGAQQLKHAAEEAASAYLIALQRFSNFVIHGIVPDDLD